MKGELIPIIFNIELVHLSLETSKCAYEEAKSKSL